MNWCSGLRGYGQPNNSVALKTSKRLARMLRSKFDFFRCHLSCHGQPVLNFELFNFSIPQIRTVLN